MVFRGDIHRADARTKDHMLELTNAVGSFVQQDGMHPTEIRHIDELSAEGKITSTEWSWDGAYNCITRTVSRIR